MNLAPDSTDRRKAKIENVMAQVRERNERELIAAFVKEVYRVYADEDLPLILALERVCQRKGIEI